jgi:protein-tyrosine phosphatase
MIRVLFVCLGNICRSPVAEAVFTHLVREAGLEDQIEIDSAGTGDWHVGQPAHRGTRAVLRENGIEYSGCGRQITQDDLQLFDYVITMDDENLANVRALANEAQSTRARITPLLDYAPDTVKNNTREVPDPYFGGGFDIVYRLVHAGCSGLLDHIRCERKL